MMGVSASLRPTQSEFARFVDDVEPRLLQALVAVCGPVDGRGATVDALSWAWEHWGRLQEIENTPAYLFRVGQSATRRYSTRPLPARLRVEGLVEDREIEPGLLPALERLSDQQRTVVRPQLPTIRSPTSIHGTSSSDRAPGIPDLPSCNLRMGITSATREARSSLPK